MDMREKVAGNLKDAHPWSDAIAREMAFVNAVVRVEYDVEKVMSLFLFLRFYSEQIVIKHLLSFCYKIDTDHNDDDPDPTGGGYGFVKKKKTYRQSDKVADGS